MMCEYETSSSVATPPPPPPPTISPQSHSLNHGTQSLAQRMLNETCYNCAKKGHWAIDCPNKTPKKSQPSSSPIDGSNVPVIQCRCGGGTCLVLTSNTVKNPGRRFYCCPVKSHNGGCRFFAWCDEMRAPMCRCGAGACSINQMTEGPNAGRKYYACRIMKGHGACPFFEWVDSQVDTTIIEQGNGSKCNCSPQSMPNSNQVFDTAYIDSGNRDDLSNENMERMEVESPVMNNSQQLPNFEASDISCRDPLGIMAVENEVDTTIIEQGNGSKCNGSPQSMPNSNQVFDTAYIDSGNIDDLSNENMERMEVESPVMNNSQRPPNFEASDISSRDPLRIMALENEQSVNRDIGEQDVGSWDPMINKAPRVSRPMFQSEIHCWQAEFSRQISATADTSTRDIFHKILSLHLLGWWGRLAFPPSGCLTDLPPGPFFSGIFPSFDPIFVPKDMGSTLLLHNSSNTEPDNPSPQPSGKEAQPSSVLCEPSGPKSPPSTVQYNGILEAYGHALLTALESIDPTDHVTMSKAASATFTLFDIFSIDYTSLSKRVEDFISCASRLAKIESSIANDLSSQELMKQYNIEKVQFDEISRIHAEAADDLTASNKNLQLLREKASCIRTMLLEIEQQLASCEAETSELKTRVAEISKHLLGSTTSMQVASEALKLNQQKEDERSAAKAALEKAKSELRL